MLYGCLDFNFCWIFVNLIEDSDDVVEVVSIVQFFIVVYEDRVWCEVGFYMMIFYGDYGCGKLYIVGVIVYQFIDQYEVIVLYCQLFMLLEMCYFVYDFGFQDNVG